MIVLTAEALDLKGIPYRTSSNIQYENKRFTRGASFSKRVFQTVRAELEKQHLVSALTLLIVEMGEHFTIWHEAEPPKPRSKRFTPEHSERSATVFPAAASIDRFHNPLETVLPHASAPRIATFEMSYRGAKYQVPIV